MTKGKHSPKNATLDLVAPGTEWFPVANFPRYWISKSGTVALLDRYGYYRLKKLGQARSGHKNVTLTHEGKKRPVNIIRLMAETFIGDPPTPQHRWVRPLDGDIRNVVPENLYWTDVCPGKGKSSRRVLNNEQKTALAADIVLIGMDAAALKHGQPISYVRHIDPGKVYEDRDRSSPDTVSTATYTPPSSDEEEWRQIEGCPGYDISSHGNARSWRCLKVSDIKPRMGTTGYLAFIASLGSKGNYENVRVHRAVAKAFCPGRTKDRYYVNHRDGNKQNNRADNLEWVTPTENMIHAVEAGLMVRGPTHGKRWVCPAPDLYPQVRDGTLDCSAYRPEVVAALRANHGWADQTPEDLPEEVWKPLVRPQVVTPVEVSSLGRVRRQKSKKLLSQNISTHGYPSTGLYIGNQKSLMSKTHGLVAEVFLGERPSTRHVVNHKDLCKENNRVENLEWITYRENSAHWSASKTS